MRKSRLPILWKPFGDFFLLSFQDLPDYLTPAAPWFHPVFVRRNHAAFHGYPHRTKLFWSFARLSEPHGQTGQQSEVSSPQRTLARVLHDRRFPFLTWIFWSSRSPFRGTDHRCRQPPFPNEACPRRHRSGNNSEPKEKGSSPQEKPKNATVEKPPSPEWPSFEDIGWRSRQQLPWGS